VERVPGGTAFTGFGQLGCYGSPIATPNFDALAENGPRYTTMHSFAAQQKLGIVPADSGLSRHGPDVPRWDSQPEPASRLFSRMMEVFAGFLGHTDHHLGRLLDFLRERGDLDNTVVMVISDNGAGAEGGPTGTTNEAQFVNNAQEPLEESLAHRRDRWPDDLQTTTRGAGRGPATPRSGGGSGRPTSGSPPPNRFRPARTNSASSSSPRLNRTSHTGAAHPGGCSSTSTRSASPRTKPRSPHPSLSTSPES
jgi:hypothetical protein